MDVLRGQIVWHDRVAEIDPNVMLMPIGGDDYVPPRVARDVRDTPQRADQYLVVFVPVPVPPPAVGDKFIDGEILHALPKGTVVRDSYGDIAEKKDDAHRWDSIQDDQYATVILPATILWLPE